jgi:hypothetical protein
MNDMQVDTVGAAEVAAATWKSRCRDLWHRLLNEGDPSEGTPVQFGIRAVLLLQALAAGALSLLMWLDLAGVFILFIGTVLVMLWRVSPNAARARRVFSDLLAGALMPIICVFFDPGVLRETQVGFPPGFLDFRFLSGTELGTILILAVLVQVGMLLLWQLTPRGAPSIAGFFVGSLFVGTLLAVAIGVCILPLTLIGLLLIVGFLGTMPFLTAMVYVRNLLSATRIAFSNAGGHLPRLTFAITTGVVVAVGLPLLLNEICGREVADYLRSLPNYGIRWL